MSASYTSKQTSYSKSHGFKRVLLWFGALGAATLTGFISFISVELAVSILAISSFAYMAHIERKRRQFWEQATDFKIKQFGTKYNTLLKAILRNSDEIEDIKQEQEKSKRRAAMHEASLRKTANKASGMPPAQSKRARSYYELIKDIQKDSIKNDEPLTNSQDAPLKQAQPFAPKKRNIRVVKGSASLFSRNSSAQTPQKDTGQATVSGKKNPAQSGRSNIFKRASSHLTIIDASHDGLSDMVVRELTRNAIRERDTDIFMQPIVTLSSSHSVKTAFPSSSAQDNNPPPAFYEIFSSIRARKNVYITASRYQKTLESHDIQSIDTLCLQKTVEKLRKSPEKTKFFINLESETLKNKDFMGFFLPFIRRNTDLLSKLVFEVKQSEFHAMSIPLLQVMRELARVGCVFTLDQMHNLNEDIADLQSYNIRYLKLNSDILVNAKKHDKQFKAVMRAKRQFEGNGISMIATHIHDKATLDTIRDYKMCYGQGFLFGKPGIDMKDPGSYIQTMQRYNDEQFISDVTQHYKTETKTRKQSA